MNPAMVMLFGCVQFATADDDAEQTELKNKP